MTAVMIITLIMMRMIILIMRIITLIMTRMITLIMARMITTIMMRMITVIMMRIISLILMTIRQDVQRLKVINVRTRPLPVSNDIFRGSQGFLECKHLAVYLHSLIHSPSFTIRLLIGFFFRDSNFNLSCPSTDDVSMTLSPQILPPVVRDDVKTLR